MLERARRKILALGDLLQLAPALDERARDAAQPKLDREPDPDRAAADDDDLMPFLQDSPLGDLRLETQRVDFERPERQAHRIARDLQLRAALLDEVRH